MKSAIKTIAVLAIIGLIVVGTFLYGNAKRQEQIRNDQNIEAQQRAESEQKAKDEETTRDQPQATGGTPAVISPGTSPAAPTETPTTTPATGSTAEALVPVALIGIGLYWYGRSRRALTAAIRVR